MSNSCNIKYELIKTSRIFFIHETVFNKKVYFFLHLSKKFPEGVKYNKHMGVLVVIPILLFFS